MNIPMLDVARLHEPIEGELRSAFDDVLRSGRFIGGSKVEGFEAALARHVGARHAVGVSSGTDALLAAMMALGVRPGDEVITSTYSFFATAGAIARLGARPVFVDIEPAGFNIAAELIEGACSPRTVGVIPVHLFGQCADMDAVSTVAEKHGLWVLEDAAQAIGATYKGKAAGTFGAAGIFSFFPAKNLGALGDAGAVVTGDGALAEKMRSLRQHGGKKRYAHDDIGGNFRLDALQAAFLSVKLPHLEGWEKKRRANAAFYDSALSPSSLITAPKELEDRRHVFNQYVLRVPRRDDVLATLREKGIATAVYYPVPLHRQPCFEALGYRPQDLPQSARASAQALAIPVEPGLTEQQRGAVASAVLEEVGPS